jgi:hypothetical protein
MVYEILSTAVNVPKIFVTESSVIIFQLVGIETKHLQFCLAFGYMKSPTMPLVGLNSRRNLMAGKMKKDCFLISTLWY